MAEEDNVNVEEISSTVTETENVEELNKSPEKVEPTQEKKDVVTTTESPKPISSETKKSETENLKFTSCLGNYLVKADVPKNVLEVIYWNQIPKSAGIFGGVMFLLLSLYCYPFLIVLTNFCLALLAVAFLYRFGMAIVNAVQKSSPEHPFQKLLEREIKVSSDRVDNFSKCFAEKLNCSIKCLQGLFLVKDFFQSLKFGVLLWLLSYVASWISPLTMVILCVLLLFTAPKLYEEKSKQIDDAIRSVSIAIASILDAMKQKLPPSVLKFLNMNEEKKNN